MYVAYDGTGTLNITQGARVSLQGNTDLGSSGGLGTIHFNGATSAMTTGALRIGGKGEGVIDLTESGRLTVQTATMLGYNGGRGTR